VNGAIGLFERKNAPDVERHELQGNCERLERKVGQLVIEKEFLEKNASSWGSIREEGSDRSFRSPALYFIEGIGHYPPESGLVPGSLK